jgi:hypothetical protein
MQFNFVISTNERAVRLWQSLVRSLGVCRPHSNIQPWVCRRIFVMYQRF